MPSPRYDHSIFTGSMANGDLGCCKMQQPREERRMKREKKWYFLTKMIKKVPKGHLFSSLFTFLSSLWGCCKYLQHPQGRHKGRPLQKDPRPVRHPAQEYLDIFFLSGIIYSTNDLTPKHPLRWKIHFRIDPGPALRGPCLCYHGGCIF